MGTGAALTPTTAGVLTGVLALFLGSCELAEVVLAEPEDIPVMEMFLRAGDEQQFALLHRTLPGKDGTGFAVPDAIIRVTGPEGQEFLLNQVHLSGCLETQYYPVGAVGHGVLPSASVADGMPPPPGTCYASLPDTEIHSGAIYHLEVALPDGRRMFGQTQVPGSLNVIEPAPDGHQCRLEPDTTLKVVWSTSDHAWAYMLEVEFTGIRTALADWDIAVPSDTLRLIGAAVSSEDTTSVFPTQMGLLERFGPDKEILLALQDGLPPGITADVTISAVDRNLVNWLRGGRFNPSGPVRVPSISGDGTGVFGSMVPVTRRIMVGFGNAPPCQ